MAPPVCSSIFAGSAQSAAPSDFRPRRGRACGEFRRLRVGCRTRRAKVLETPARRRDAYHARRLSHDGFPPEIALVEWPISRRRLETGLQDTILPYSEVL